MSLRFLRITRQNLSQHQARLEALERTSVYPLGDDAFQISHGDSYLAFFEHLGGGDPARVAYYALVDDQGLACVGCGVRRPAREGLPERWYIGDVKVRPDRRGQHLVVALIRRAFIQNWLRCGRGYAVAMNPADGRVPPAVRAFAHFKWLPMALVGMFQLDIFAADHDGLRTVWPLLVGHRGPARLVSTTGRKDLELRSTGRPLPLLHVQHRATDGVDGDGAPDRAPDRALDRAQGHTTMWCTPRGSALGLALEARGVVPMASATVVHHRLGGLDWEHLDTSEI